MAVIKPDSNKECKNVKWHGRFEHFGGNTSKSQTQNTLKNIKRIMWLINFTPRYLSKKNKSMPHNTYYMSTIIIYCKPKWKNKTYVYVTFTDHMDYYWGIKRCSDICYSTTNLWKHCAKSKKAITKGPMLYEFNYMKYRE